jgi:hypothetical protein
MKAYPWGKGTVKWLRDDAPNDSDKSFPVPAGKVWDVLSIAYELVASAVVGNRQMAVYITDGTDALWTTVPSPAVAALTPCNGRFAPNLPTDNTMQLARLDTYGWSSTISVTGPLPRLLLPAGHVVRVSDYKAIDPAGDPLVVVLQYVEYDA